MKLLNIFLQIEFLTYAGAIFAFAVFNVNTKIDFFVLYTLLALARISSIVYEYAKKKNK